MDLPVESSGAKAPSDQSGALQLALQALDHRYGKGVLRSAEAFVLTGMETGVGPLDALTPCGGLPRGRLSWLSGAPGEGAFELSLAMLARISNTAPVAVVDFDQLLDPGDIQDYGGDLASCWVVRPRLPQAGWAAARSLIRAGVEFCVLLAREWGPVSRAAAAALLAAVEERNSVALLGGGSIISQQLSGRVGIEFACERQGWVTTHQDVSGIQLLVRVARSRLGPPGRSCRLQIDFPRVYAKAGVLAPAVPGSEAGGLPDGGEIPVQEVGV
ncbi:MAG: hypothetical protein ACYDHB_03175 [Candidatus Dormibacteria bacterium]